uniref:Uncharacterized protein n=1 Tax=Aegilops tauschii subsp. strangulata TaxID=200361 RepID=A0A453PQN2_AEGTS
GHSSAGSNRRFSKSSLACHAASSTGKPAGLLALALLFVYIHVQLVLRDAELINLLPAICSACVDNIKMVYGQDSPELGNFKRVIREESSKHEASMNEVKLLDTTNTTGT